MNRISFAVILISIAVILFVNKIVFIGWVKQDTSALLLNFATEFISITLTVIFLDVFIRNQEKRKREEEYKHIISTVLGNRLSILFKEITSTYINFIKKEPSNIDIEQPLKSYKETIEDTLRKLDEYIDEDFRRGQVYFYYFDPRNTHLATQLHSIEYQEYCETLFKRKINGLTGEFIHRYISILPNDLKLSIYIIENSMASKSFMTFLEYGFRGQIETSEVEVQDLKTELTKIGNELLNIYEIIEIGTKG